MGGSIKNVQGISQQSTPPQTQNTWRRGTELTYNLNKLNNHLDYNNNSTVPPISQKFVIAKADSGASKHYIRQQDMNCLTNVTKKNGPTVYLPNMEAIQTTHVGLLPYKKSLSQSATTANVLPNLQSASLISIGQLCDDNCDVTLKKIDRCFV